jgi:hypothetical protein
MVAGVAALTVAATAAEGAVTVIVVEVAEVAEAPTEAVVDTPVAAEAAVLTAVGAAIRIANPHCCC